MDSKATKLAAIILPVRNLKLMLPASMIAEVVSGRSLALTPASPASPPWQLGAFHWRGWTVPLINFDSACGQSPATRVFDLAGSRSIVLKKPHVGSSQPFIAFVIDGAPRVVTTTPESLAEMAPLNGEASPFVARYVTYDNEQLVIPSFSAIEQSLNAYVAKTKARAES